MENEKNVESAEIPAGAEDADGGLASRARNRTVMLTPEITGEVRARLAQDMTDPEPAPEAMSSYAPAGEAPAATPSAPAPSQDSYEPVSTPSPITAQPAAPVAAAPAAPAPVAQSGDDCVVWTKPSPIVGFLVSYDSDENGAVYELRSGRIIVSNARPGDGNYLLINDDTVSPMHAIIRVAADGTIQVLDQLSEFGTKIIRIGESDPEELSGEKSILGHGDLLMFGERSFHVCTVVPRGKDSDE